MSEDKSFKRNKTEEIEPELVVDKVDKKDIKSDTEVVMKKTVNKNVKKLFDVAKKIEVIKNSKMPDYQKDEYIKRLQPEVLDDSKKIPFNVYVKIKGISATNIDAMKFYPKAIGVDIATMESWDKIFTDF